MTNPSYPPSPIFELPLGMPDCHRSKFFCLAADDGNRLGTASDFGMPPGGSRNVAHTVQRPRTTDGIVADDETEKPQQKSLRSPIARQSGRGHPSSQR